MSDLQASFARTCHDFAGAEQGDLAFTTGDVLFIDRLVDSNWCHGESLTTGRSGIFPSNFVKKLEVPKKSPTGSQKLFLSRGRFIGQEQGDLSFLEGDIIVGLRQVDDNWWEGEAGGRRGIFPLTFVIELTPPSATIHSASPVKQCLNQGIVYYNESSTATSNEIKAKVKHDLIPVEPEELELKAGEIVIIEEFVDKFTCRGRTQDGRRGVFGKAFVETINEPAARNVNAGRGSFVQQSATLPAKPFDSLPSTPAAKDSIYLPINLGTPVSPVPVAKQKPEVSPKPVVHREAITRSPVLDNKSSAKETVAPYGRTKYKFPAEYPGELSFEADIIIHLTRHVDDEWTEGILDGKRGIFPTSYVDIVVDCPRLQLKSLRSPSEPRKSSDWLRQERRAGSYVRGMVGDSGSASSGGEEGQTARLDYGTGVQDGTSWIVKCDFMGTEDEDLTAFKGDPVDVLKKINDEWAEARHGITGQQGVIPLSYLQSPGPQVRWRHENGASRRDSRVVSASLDTTIAQNIKRLESAPVTAKIEQPHWSPEPGLSNQSVAAYPGATYAAITPFQQFRPENAVNGKGVQIAPRANCAQQTSSVEETKRSTPPPRPAVPAALKMRQETACQHLEMQRQRAKEQKKKEMRSQRSKVIQEILTTEREYGKDLLQFRDIVLSKRNMLDASVLLGGTVWSDVAEVSAQLVANLEKEIDKDFVYQEIGSAFLDLSNDFKKIYGAFCQSHVESQALLEKYEVEPEKQAVLKDMLTKVQQGTTCIDLSTMLSRPVQRVLKYPLFLGELSKVTEDNQSDKVKLMMALKVMTEVAQSMNESKRRKDLVTKYRGDGDITFSERLSRLTLHSMRKKSTRLSMRLSSTIGLTQLAKDDKFEDAERQFRAIDRCCRTVLRDVQSYCEQAVVLYNHHMSIADSLNSGFAVSVTSDPRTSPRSSTRTSYPSHRQSDTSAGGLVSVSPSTQLPTRYLELWSKVLLSECILQKFFDAVKAKVRQPLAHIQHSCKGPDKLISKRIDKLLDYESVTAKLEKADGAGGADSAKVSALEEELRKAKVEYEAMNAQLVTELPQFNRLASEIITMAVRAFIASQRTFVYEFGRCCEQTIGNANVTAGCENVLEKFQRKHRQAVETMAHLCFFADAGSSGISKSTGTVIKRQASVGSTVSRASSQTKKSRPAITFPHKVQTESERGLLRGQYGSRKLFIVSGGYEARGDLELTLLDGELVGVIVDKDPMGNGDRWFVDNGVSKGFVPRNILRSATVQEKLLISAGGKPALELIDLSEAAERRKRDRVDIAGPMFGENQCLPVETVAGSTSTLSTSRLRTQSSQEAPVFTHILHEKHAAVATRAPMRRTTIQSCDQPASSSRPAGDNSSSARPVEAASYSSMHSKVHRRPAPAPPKELGSSGREMVNLQPVRPAPRPPSQNNAAPDAMAGERDERRDGTGEIEFYIAMYSFVANSENELSLTEGQTVAVHDKTDLEANPEWWLVEDEEGALGYVPGNYLTPYVGENGSAPMAKG